MTEEQILEYIKSKCIVFTVYKTVEVETGRYYIGVHATKNPNDGYLGSGNEITTRVKKKGSTAFKKEILHIYDTPGPAFEKEIKILDQCLLDPLCMNQSTGGRGLKPWLISQKCITTLRQNTEKIRGKHLTRQCRERISAFVSSTVWITNGINNKRVNPSLSIPQGWRKGKAKLKNRRVRTKPHSEQEIINLSKAVKLRTQNPQERIRLAKISKARWAKYVLNNEKKFRLCYFCFTSFIVHPSSLDQVFCSRRCSKGYHAKKT